MKHTLEHDTRMLKNKEYHEEVREMLERLSVDPDKILALDTDENIPKLMEARALVKEISISISIGKLFDKDEKGRYGIRAKLTAITVMLASLGIMENFGVAKDFAPYYAGVSRWLGVNIATLRNWWKHRDAIQMEQGALDYTDLRIVMADHVSLAKLYTEALKLTKEELKEMRKTPQGLKVISQIKVSTLLSLTLLNKQLAIVADVSSNPAKKEETHKGVSILMPNEVENE